MLCSVLGIALSVGGAAAFRVARPPAANVRRRGRAAVCAAAPPGGDAAISRLRAAVAQRVRPGTKLDGGRRREVVSYLNQQLPDELLEMVLAATDLGQTAARKNMFVATARSVPLPTV